MNQFQTSKQTELLNSGFSLVGEKYLPGPGRSKTKEYIFKFQNASGRKAYVYPTWVQFI